MNIKDAQELLDLMQRHLGFYKEYLDLLILKLNAMSQNQLDELDEYVKSEEAYFLRVKGIELERTRFLKKMGLDDLTFREIIPLFPDSLHNDIQEIFSELSAVLLNIKATNLQCKSMAEMRLHRIQSTLNNLENNQDSQKTYSKKAQVNQVKRNFISKKI